MAASRLRYDSDLSVGFRNYNTGTFLFLVLKKVRISLWRGDPVLELKFLAPLRVVLL